VIALNLVIIAVVLIIGFSIGQALGSPGSAGVQSRVGNWARDHHLTFLAGGV
jgi:hypothetical protein